MEILTLNGHNSIYGFFSALSGKCRIDLYDWQMLQTIASTLEKIYLPPISLLNRNKFKFR